MNRILYVTGVLLVVILVIAWLIAGINNTRLSPDTIDLSVDCSSVTRLGVTAVVRVNVSNHSGRTHDLVNVQLQAEDQEGNPVTTKTIQFSRTLKPGASFSKTVTLPARTRYCNCKITDSSPH